MFTHRPVLIKQPFSVPFMDYTRITVDAKLAPIEFYCNKCYHIVLQVNGYAAAHGIRYGMISNTLWSWVFWMDGRNNMSISKAFRYDATDPTVLQVSCCVLVLSLSSLCKAQYLNPMLQTLCPNIHPLGGSTAVQSWICKSQKQTIYNECAGACFCDIPVHKA